MAIITISREFAALGDETARRLSDFLGYRLIERSFLEEKMRSSGIEQSKLEKFAEKKLSLFSSLSRDRDEYVHFLKSAIFEEALQGDCIFCGRGAGIILKSVTGVLNVFLSSPEEIRTERVKAYFHCDERRALQIIYQADKDREGFYRHFFDINWKESSNYHLCINSGFIHPDTSVMLIKTLADKLNTEDSEKQSQIRVMELSLGHQIKHLLLFEKEMQIQFLEVLVTGNKILLYGAASSRLMIENAVNTVKECVLGDFAENEYIVQPEIQVVQEYNVMP